MYFESENINSEYNIITTMTHSNPPVCKIIQYKVFNYSSLL